MGVVCTSLKTFVGHNYRLEYFIKHDFMEKGIKVAFFCGQFSGERWLYTKNNHKKIWMKSGFSLIL